MLSVIHVILVIHSLTNVLRRNSDQSSQFLSPILCVPENTICFEVHIMYFNIKKES